MKDWEKIEKAIEEAYTDADIYTCLKKLKPAEKVLQQISPTMRLHEWEALRTKLKYGALRYVLGCETPESLFVKWANFILADVTHGCTCCLYWQGVFLGFLLGALLMATLMK